MNKPPHPFFAPSSRKKMVRRIKTMIPKPIMPRSNIKDPRDRDNAKESPHKSDLYLRDGLTPTPRMRLSSGLPDHATVVEIGQDNHEEGGGNDDENHEDALVARGGPGFDSSPAPVRNGAVLRNGANNLRSGGGGGSMVLRNNGRTIVDNPAIRFLEACSRKGERSGRSPKKKQWVLRGATASGLPRLQRSASFDPKIMVHSDQIYVEKCSFLYNDDDFPLPSFGSPPHEIATPSGRGRPKPSPENDDGLGKSPYSSLLNVVESKYHYEAPVDGNDRRHKEYAKKLLVGSSGNLHNQNRSALLKTRSLDDADIRLRAHSDDEIVGLEHRMRKKKPGFIQLEKPASPMLRLQKMRSPSMGHNTSSNGAVQRKKDEQEEAGVVLLGQRSPERKTLGEEIITRTRISSLTPKEDGGSPTARSPTVRRSRTTCRKYSTSTLVHSTKRSPSATSCMSEKKHRGGAVISTNAKQGLPCRFLTKRQRVGGTRTEGRRATEDLAYSDSPSHEHKKRGLPLDLSDDHPPRRRLLGKKSALLAIQKTWQERDSTAGSRRFRSFAWHLMVLMIGIFVGIVTARHSFILELPDVNDPDIHSYTPEELKEALGVFDPQSSSRSLNDPTGNHAMFHANITNYWITMGKFKINDETKTKRRN